VRPDAILEGLAVAVTPTKLSAVAVKRRGRSRLKLEKRVEECRREEKRVE
jgi:hypothetical protein